MSQSRQNTGMARPKPTGDPNPFDILDESRHQVPRNHVESRRGRPGRLGQDEIAEYSGTESERSDGSAESHGAVEKAVMEDMAKFEDTFKGITERFRLINRIGEGTEDIIPTLPQSRRSYLTH